MCIDNNFTSHVRMVNYVTSEKNIFDIIQKSFGDNCFNFKFVLRKIHDLIVNKRDYLQIFFIFPLSHLMFLILVLEISRKTSAKSVKAVSSKNSTIQSSIMFSISLSDECNEYNRLETRNIFLNATW